MSPRSTIKDETEQKAESNTHVFYYHNKSAQLHKKVIDSIRLNQYDSSTNNTCCINVRVSRFFFLHSYLYIVV